MAEKRAAIKADKLGETPLEKLSAAQFVQALEAREELHLVSFWPEKKKYELETEPTLVGKLKFKEFVEIVERVKGEKKKAEYEIEHRWHWVTDPDPIPWRFGPHPEPALLATRLDSLATQLKRLSAKVDQIAGR